MTIKYYEPVERAQSAMLRTLTASQASTRVECRIDPSLITIVDGKWGEETTALFNGIAKFFAENDCTIPGGSGAPGLLPSYTIIKNGGPSSMSEVFTKGTMGRTFSLADVSILQRAWRERAAVEDVIADGGIRTVDDAVRFRNRNMDPTLPRLVIKPPLALLLGSLGLLAGAGVAIAVTK